MFSGKENSKCQIPERNTCFVYLGSSGEASVSEPRKATYNERKRDQTGNMTILWNGL